MSSLIPQRDWSELLQLSAEQRRKIHACEVYDEKGYVGTLIPLVLEDSYVADNIRTQSEYLSQRSNSVRARDVIENKNICVCGFEAKSPFGLIAHKRSHKTLVEV